MLITSFFTDRGIPKTGLSATISIIDLSDGSSVVSDATMTERNSGYYIYDFIEYDSLKDYGIIADGTDTLSNPDRYKDNTNATEYDVGDIEITVSEIKQQTNRIPDFPASANEYDAEFVAIQNDIIFLKNIEGGRWKIDTNTKQMIFYDEAGIVEIARFQLYDKDHVPSDTNVVERERM